MSEVKHTPGRWYEVNDVIAGELVRDAAPEMLEALEAIQTSLPPILCVLDAIPEPYMSKELVNSVSKMYGLIGSTISKAKGE